MSEGCEIINSNVITINGGNGAYGGHMTSCSFSFGTLSAQGHRANVTLEGKNLGTPRIGESITISIFGSSFLFDVSLYSKSSSARSMTTMSLNCVDISHRMLDHVHIILDEENEYTGGNVYKLGKKMLTEPDFLGPYMFPKPTTKWDSVTNVFPHLDPLVAPGKSRYGVKQDGKGGQTLNDVIQGIIEMPSLVDIQNIPLDFEGSLRNIITNLALQVGVIPVYDMTSNSIKVLPATGDDDGSSFNLAAGTEKLEKIGGKCLVVSATETEDFTSTEAQGAIGKTEFSPSGNSGGPKGGRDKGGKSTRFRKAWLLNPDFHYGACGTPADKVLPFDDRPEITTKLVTAQTLELEQALGCSFDAKVWALFVLQSVLNEVETPIPALEISDQTPGEDNEKEKNTYILSDGLVTAPSNFKENKFIAEYYMNGKAPCGAGPSTVQIAGMEGEDHADPHPVIVTVEIKDEEVAEGKVKRPNPPALNPLANALLMVAAEKWNTRVNDVPFVFAGAVVGNAPEATAVAFQNADMFLHQAGKFSTILNVDGTLDGESDFFRRYLMAVTNFKLRYFVIEGKDKKMIQNFYPNGKGGYYAVDSWKKLPTYDGMMLTTEGSLGASNIKAPDGYTHEAINPYRPLSASFKPLQELAKACYWMYFGNGGGGKVCIETFLGETSVGEFIRALKENKLKEFFGGAFENEVELQKEEDEKDLKKAGKLYMINLMVAKEGAEGSDFSATETTCNSRVDNPNQIAGETRQLREDGAAITMTKMMYDIGKDIEGNVKGIFGPKTIDLGFGPDAFANPEKAMAFNAKITEQGLGFNLIAIQNGQSMAEVVPAVQIRDSELSGLTCITKQKTKEVIRGKSEDGKGGVLMVVPVNGKFVKRCFIRCWYDHEQDPAAVGGIGAPNRYVINAYSSIPALWPRVWKTNLQKGFSVSPSDFEWEKHRDEGDGSTDYSYEGPEYETKIVGRTKIGLDEIVQANTWIDSIPAKSKSITIIADESLDFGLLPGVTEGLQSLDVSLSGDKTTITITIGNTNYKQQMKMIRDANVKALEAGHRSSTLHKQKQLDNLKIENVFNIG